MGRKTIKTLVSTFFVLFFVFSVASAQPVLVERFLGATNQNNELMVVGSGQSNMSWLATQMADNNGYNVTVEQPTSVSGYYSLITTKSVILAQSINLTANDTVDGIIIQGAEFLHTFLRENNCGLYISLHGNNATEWNHPNLAILEANATVRIPPNDVISGSTNTVYHGLTTAIFNSSISLEANVVYWITVRALDCIDARSYFVMAYNNTNPYTRGFLVSSNDNGTTWTNYTTFDYFFMILKKGLHTQTIFNYSESTATMGENWSLFIEGATTFTIGAETLYYNLITANAGITTSIIRLGARNSGTLIMEGNSTNPATIIINGSNTKRPTYAIYNVGMGKFYGNHFKIEGASVYLLHQNGAFTQMIAKNCLLNLTYNAGSYNVIIGSASYISQISNCTLNRINYNSYSIYMGGSTTVPLIATDINMTGSVGTTPIYVAVYGNYYVPTFINSYINTTKITATNFVMCYNTSSFILGNKVEPTIMYNGQPLAGATIILTPQIHPDDLPLYMMFNGENGIRDGSIGHITPNPMPNAPFEPNRQAITGTDGKPKDKDGNSPLFMYDRLYGQSDKHTMVYFGGNTSGLRPLDYIWKNDGTDYGYILTITYSGLKSETRYLNPSDGDYLSTITMTSNTYPPVHQEPQGTSEYPIKAVIVSDTAYMPYEPITMATTLMNTTSGEKITGAECNFTVWDGTGAVWYDLYSTYAENLTATETPAGSGTYINNMLVSDLDYGTYTYEATCSYGGYTAYGVKSFQIGDYAKESTLQTLANYVNASYINVAGISGLVYHNGDTVDSRVITTEKISGAELEDGYCYGYIFKPNGKKWGTIHYWDEIIIGKGGSSSGIYINVDMVVDDEIDRGIYVFQVTCTKEGYITSTGSGTFEVADEVADESVLLIPISLAIFSVVFGILSIFTTKDFVFYQYLYLVIALLLAFSSVALMQNYQDSPIIDSLLVVFVGLIGFIIFYIFITTVIFVFSMFKQKRK